MHSTTSSLTSLTTAFMHLYEKAREEYYHDIRCGSEKRRRLSRPPLHRQSIIRYTAGKLGILLLKLGTWLKQFEQPPAALSDHS